MSILRKDEITTSRSGPAGQGMLPDYAYSLHSHADVPSVGQPLPRRALDPAALQQGEQLLFYFAKKRAGGRPKTDRAELRSVVIPVRYTEHERALLKSNAARNNMSISTYIAVVSLNEKLPAMIPAVNLDTYARLCSIAREVNELKARAIEAASSAETLSKLEEIRAAMTTIVGTLVSLKPVEGGHHG